MLVGFSKCPLYKNLETQTVASLVSVVKSSHFYFYSAFNNTAEVERVQKYSTQVKVPKLMKFYLSTSKSTSLKIYSSKSKK